MPALIVTEEVTLIFYSTNLEGGFQGRIAVAPMVEDMTLGAWETYVLTSLPPDYPPYPFGDGDYYGARFIQHGDHIYLYVDEGAAGNKLLATAAEIPTTANHWVATEILSFVDVPDSDSGAAPGRLAFIGDKPVFIGAHEVFSEAFGGVWFYFDYLAIANTPLPDSRDDWDVMALPEPAGSSMDADQRDNFALAISTTSDGGIAYVEPDLTGRLQVYYTPNEAALRAGAWQPGFLSDPLWTNGTPVEFLPYHDRLLLAYNPISGGRRLTDQLHLALSADSTGTVSSWSIQPLTGVLTPGTVTRLSARTATPLAIWGDRLILFEDDANGVRLRRATVSGLPAMDQWQSQLIAPLPPYNGAGGPSRPGTAIAVHGLDCFVAFANTENPDVPGELSIATAEGSW